VTSSDIVGSLKPREIGVSLISSPPHISSTRHPRTSSLLTTAQENGFRVKITPISFAHSSLSERTRGSSNVEPLLLVFGELDRVSFHCTLDRGIAQVLPFPRTPHN
jgi:hypothetical protein